MAQKNLFVSGLSADVDDASLLAIFKSCGDVLSAKVMLNINTGKSRSFGFVLFSNQEDAMRAEKELNGKLVGHSLLKVKPAQHDGMNVLVPTSKVYVRNLPENVAADDLQKRFSQFGVVTGCTIRPEIGAGDSRSSIVFVEFDDHKDARKAVDGVHGKMDFMPGCTVPLIAKLAETQNMRAARQARNNQGKPTSPGAGPLHVPTTASPSSSGQGRDMSPTSNGTPTTTTPPQFVSPQTPNISPQMASLPGYGGYPGFPIYMYPSAQVTSPMMMPLQHVMLPGGGLTPPQMALQQQGMYCPTSPGMFAQGMQGMASPLQGMPQQVPTDSPPHTAHTPPPMALQLTPQGAKLAPPSTPSGDTWEPINDARIQNLDRNSPQSAAVTPPHNASPKPLLNIPFTLDPTATS